MLIVNMLRLFHLSHFIVGQNGRQMLLNLSLHVALNLH